MKKDRNSPNLSKPDHSLPRSKILRGRKNFQRLFENSTVLNSKSFQFRYRLYSDPAEGCFIGFAAPKKKIAQAVKRNRVKRLLREAYRTRQSHLQDLFESSSFGFHGLFMANFENASLQNISDEMDTLLPKIREQLLLKANIPSQSEPPNNI